MAQLYGYQNKINGKWYIGQTMRSVKERRYNDEYSGYKGSPRFYNAINKYGVDTFELTIFYDGSFTKRELDLLEQHYIWKYDSVNIGYNLSTGGSNGNHSDESKLKISEKIKLLVQGSDNPNFRYSVSKDQLIQWNHVEGLNLEDIKLLIGCSNGEVVNRIFKRLGVEYIKPTVINFTREQLIELNIINMLSYEEMASLIGCSVNNLKYRFDKLNISYISPYTYNVNKEQLIQWNHVEGLNLREIKEKIGCSNSSAARKIFDRTGVDYISPGKRKKNKLLYAITKEQLVQWNHIEGLKLADIRKILGCSNNSVVHKMFIRNGIEYKY